MFQPNQLPTTQYPENTDRDALATFASTLVERLKHHGIVIITGLPTDVKQTAGALFEYGDRTFDALETGRLSPTLPNANSGVDAGNVIHVLSKSQQRFGGCLFGNRLVTNQSEASIDKCVLPQAGGVDMTTVISAFRHFNTFSRQLMASVLAQFESNLQLQPGSLSLDNGPVGLTRYIPATHAGIRRHYNDNKSLCISAPDSKALVTFKEHVDISPLTLLYYRHGKCDGLQFKTHNNQWVPVTLPSAVDGALVLFSGRQLQLLTNGHVAPIAHRVILTPEQAQAESQLSAPQMRHLLAYFGFYSQPEFRPASTLDGKPIAPPPGVMTPYESLECDRGTSTISAEQLLMQNFKLSGSVTVTDDAAFQSILDCYPEHSVYQQEMEAKRSAARSQLERGAIVSSTQSGDADVAPPVPPVSHAGAAYTSSSTAPGASSFAAST